MGLSLFVFYFWERLSSQLCERLIGRIKIICARIVEMKNTFIVLNIRTDICSKVGLNEVVIFILMSKNVRFL